MLNNILIPVVIIAVIIINGNCVVDDDIVFEPRKWEIVF